jgi:SAM-dependent methyltransferase
MSEEKIKQSVRKEYGKIATQSSSCCSPSSDCGSSDQTKTSDPSKDINTKIGYTKGELETIPEESNLGLGCGNPTAISSLKEGEIVLDLGSGAGGDCFLAANKVGQTGQVIGVDMTAEMLEKARANAEKGKYTNVEFRLGEIEHLPVGDNSVDVIISNCVINLVPNKEQVFREAFRVLKPGGRVYISDIVLNKPLPKFAKTMDAYVGCVAGAVLREEYLKIVKDQGFDQINIHSDTSFGPENIQVAPGSRSVTKEQLEDVSRSVASLTFSATKPA